VRQLDAGLMAHAALRSAPMYRALAALALSAAALGQPSQALAAACCGSGHGIGPVLAEGERAALSVGVGEAERFGQWSSRGEYVPQSGGGFDRELRTELGWIVRASGPLQLGVTVPMIYTFKQSGRTSSSGGGAGDITAFARYDLVASQPSRWFPGIAPTLAALVPTGLPLARSSDPLGADATGLGTGEIRPGVTIEKRWLAGFSATLLASVGFRFGYHLESGEKVSPSPRLSLLAAAGPFWDFGLSASLGLLVEREGAPSIDGRAEASAERGKTAAVLFVAYDLSAHFTALASAQLDLPVSGAGRNEPLAVTSILGVRRVWGFLD